MDEGVAEIRKAQELDPLSLVIHADVALLLYYARRYDEAIEQSAKTLELEPNFALAHYYQGFAYERKAMYADALRAYDRMGPDEQRSPGLLVNIGRALALSGNREEALRILRRLHKLSERRHVAPDKLMGLYAALGDTDRVVSQLEKAIRESGPCVAAPVMFEPRFDEVRADPRVAALLRQAQQDSTVGRP